MKRIMGASNLAKAVAAVVLGLVFATQNADAAPVTQEQAVRAVGNYLSKTPEPMGAKVGRQSRHARTFNQENTDTPLFHVVEMEGGGFIVTSADTGIEPVIVISGEGGFDPVPENPLYSILTKDMAMRKDALEAAKAENGGNFMKAQNNMSGESPETKWTELLTDIQDGFGGYKYATGNPSDIRVNALVGTQWGQSTHNGLPSGVTVFNYYTPLGGIGMGQGNPNNAVCGCVATAMSQLLYYHAAKGNPPGNVSPTMKTYWYNGKQSSFPLKGGTYDWALMEKKPKTKSSWTPAERQAIGKICFDAGLSVNMKYNSPGESGAAMESIAPAFKSVFGYQSAVAFIDYVRGLPENVIQNAILVNLDNGYPVQLGVDGPQGGHCILADGYGYIGSTRYVHLNMGWTGSDDLWYTFPTIGTTPEYKYYITIVDSVIYNVFKDSEKKLLSGRVLNSSGSPVAGATVQVLNSSGQSVANLTTDSKGMYKLARTGTGGETLKLKAISGTQASDEASVSLTLSTSASIGNVYRELKLNAAATTYYTVNVSATAGGTVSVNGGASAAFASGAPCTVTAKASTGYTFQNWTEGGTVRSTSASYTFTVTGNRTLVANFTAMIPSAPTNVTATQGSHTDRIVLSWSSVSGATSYKVYRNTSASSAGATLVASSVASASYTDNDPTLVPRTTYYYWVKASNNGGDSGFSSYATGWSMATTHDFGFYTPSGWGNNFFLSDTATGKTPKTSFQYGERIYYSFAFTDLNNLDCNESIKVVIRIVDDLSSVLYTWQTLPWNSYAYIEGSGGVGSSWQWLNPGTHTITCTLNDGNAITETNYANNTKSVTFTVVGAPYNVTFNGNGGDPATQTIPQKYGENYVLPASPPTLAGNTFMGWYTHQTYGTQVTSATKVTDNYSHTLWARWSVPVGTTLHVNALRPDDSGDGWSWGTAKKTIQAAVSAAVAGNTILVADGVYTPISTGNKAILIQSVNGEAVTIIDGGGTCCAELGSASGHTSTVLTGFTLRNGKGRLLNSYNGGGSYYGTLNNCVLTGNTGSNGGGAYGGILNNCVLSNNTASSYNYGYGGGAAGATLNNCTLAGNTAINGNGGGANSCIMNNCTLSNNTADFQTSGGYGGGADGGTLNNCTLTGNSARQGGGARDSKMNNCVISNNTASLQGGGVYRGTLNNCVLTGNKGALLTTWAAYDTTLNNCTVAENKGCGVYGGTLYNSIVWGNVNGNGATNNYSGTINIHYSCITLPPASGTGNIDADPLFVNATGGDFRLQTGSPCIDRGSNTHVASATDFEGNTRIWNGIVDMGVYEYGSLPPNTFPVLFNGSGGTPASQTVTQTYNSIYVLPTKKPTLAGHVFTGWFTQQNGGEQVTTSTMVAQASTHTLWAQWQACTEFTVGTGTANTYQIPFNFNLNTSAAQTIYLQSELQEVRGKQVAGIDYFYYKLTGEVNDRAVQVWIAPTTLDDLSDGWIPQEQFTKVYDGFISVSNGFSVSTVSLTFDTPYLYTNGNLCVMTIRLMDSQTFSTGTNAKTTNVPTARTREYGSLYSVFNFTQAGTALSAIPNIRFKCVDTPPPSFSVVFDASGGEPATQIETQTTGSAYVLPDTDPTLEGHIFDGWFTTRDDGMQVNPDMTVTQTSEHTLYAHWKPISPPLTLDEAVNAPQLEWRTGGDDGWFPQARVSSDGLHAAESGAKGVNYGISWIETTVTGPGRLSFNWKVSSEEKFDCLGFSMNGEEVMAISGEKDWEQWAFEIMGDETVLRWTYEKDKNSDEGDGCGWLDDVVWTPKPMTLGEAVNAPKLNWQTGGDADWFAQTTESHDGLHAARSGAIGDNGSTWIEATVAGSGTLSFWWRVSSEGGADFLEFLVDGQVVTSISGTKAGWTEESAIAISGNGSHSLRWRYRKDGSDSAGEDCGWLDEVEWVPAGINATTTTPRPVPHSWLDEKFPGNDGAYEDIANRVYGVYAVWESYVIGFEDPTDTGNRFAADIAIVDGKPVITWWPDLGKVRDYILLGKPTLDATEWVELDPDNIDESMRFFKVTVDLRIGD